MLLCKLKDHLGNYLLAVSKWSLLLLLTCPWLFHETVLILVSVITEIILFTQYLGVAKRKEGWIKCVSWPALSIFHGILPCALIIFYLGYVEQQASVASEAISCGPLHPKFLSLVLWTWELCPHFGWGSQHCSPWVETGKEAAWADTSLQNETIFMQLSLVIKGNGGFRESLQYFSRWSCNRIFFQSLLWDIRDS